MDRIDRMLLLTMATLSIANIAYGGQPSPDEFTADKAVLTAVVSLQCQGRGRGKVLLSSKPSAPDDTTKGYPSGISDAQTTDLISRTEATDALPKGIECRRVRIVPYARLKAAFDRPAKRPMEFPVPVGVLIPIGANTGFKDTFPDVGILLRLSMPAYSPTKDMAVVYFSEDCGGLCAHGEYVLLQHANGTWRVIKRVQAWAS